MDEKESVMGTVEITSIFKYLWVVVVPVLAKWWNSVEIRFKKTEDKVDRVDEKLDELTATVKVLAERSENQGAAIDRMEALLMKLLLKEKQD